jgi:phosphohistidine phosphatase SixA
MPKPASDPSQAAPPVAKPSAKVEKLALKLVDRAVEVTWVAPSGTELVRVVRSRATPVEVPDAAEATTIYAGTAAKVSHPLAELLSDEPKGDDATDSEWHYAAFACRNAADCDKPPARASLRPRLIDALRKGGYVFYFRHGTANECQDVEPLGTADKTEKPGWWKSCDSNCATATARQISPEGIAEMKQLGRELARLKLPFSKVVSSEFCRNVQSAKLLALKNRGKLLPVATAKHLTSFVYDEPNRCKNVYAMLGEPPPRGSNVVLVGQKGNECPVVGALDPAGVAIFKPDGQGGTQAVATLKWTDWASY